MINIDTGFETWLTIEERKRRDSDRLGKALYT